VIAPSDRVVCILTGHQLKDPDATVAYHSGDKALFESKLGSRGVTQAAYANSPVVVENNLQKIIAALEE
jgi:threonine synthase